MKKTVFKGRLINLSVEWRKFPNGNTIRLEVIKHPGAALIVPFITKNKIVMIRQYRPVINQYIWELPAGTLGKGESPLECAKREIVEETGFKARSFKQIGVIYPAPGYTSEKIIIFKACGLVSVERHLEEDEVIAAKVLNLNQVKTLLKTGKIVDAKTICALALAKIAA